MRIRPISMLMILLIAMILLTAACAKKAPETEQKPYAEQAAGEIPDVPEDIGSDNPDIGGLDDMPTDTADLS